MDIVVWECFDGFKEVLRVRADKDYFFQVGRAHTISTSKRKQEVG
jgi:hypothetical protein